ncbi:MAG: flagella basal body P-ring formation protein FlgA [Erythrobacter sp.]|uniref:flagella basal body P-ring formation protein FlgA n=1 Tax=Erythrobacter sp. TaxID=1042 RepID=UPI0032EC5A3F
MAVPFFAPALGESASGSARTGDRTDPAAIDAAVAAFTGVGVGEPGGAIAPADRRLRLAPCPAPLETAWHGRARTTVRVACPGPGGWRVFVALRAGPAAGNAAGIAARPAARAAPLVERGDPVTVMVRGRGFTVQQAGEAMEAGRAGDWIGIRLAATSRAASRSGRPEPVRARIVRPGLAEIPVGRAPGKR